jgi:hypothetical protein
MMTEGIAKKISRLGLLPLFFTLATAPGPGLLASPQFGGDFLQVPARTYFPLQTGYRWVYSKAGAATWEVSVGERQAAAPFRAYRELSGYFGNARVVASTLSGTVTERGSDGRDYLWYQFGALAGRSWVMQFPPGTGPSCEDGATLSIGARNEIVSVPAGTFQRVVRIDFTTPCADAGIIREWFAPGVGLIRREEITIAGPVISELVYAELGETVLPQASYGTSLILSSPRHINDLMPPVDASGFARMSGALVIRNQTAEPVEFVFPSACREVRLELRNEAGELVLTRRFPDFPCPQVITRVVLTRRSLVVPFSFVLADESGRPLPDGPYSLTAVLVTAAPEVLRPAVRTRIEVFSTH